MTFKKQKKQPSPTRSFSKKEPGSTRSFSKREPEPTRSFSKKEPEPRRSLAKKDSPKHEKASQNLQILKRKNEFKREKELYIWGKRTVESYFSKLHTQENIVASNYTLHIIVDKANKAPAQLKSIVQSAQALGISIKSHTSADDPWPIASQSNLNHQRVCLKVPEYPISYLEDVISLLKKQDENSQHACLGLVLDQIQDPRNFGAILRSASFFGVKFVIFGKDRQSEINSLVLKTSAGGAFSLMLVPVVNINRALVLLKEAGAWVIGSTLQSEAIGFSQLPKDRNWVLVLGNEETGLRSEVTKNCDYLVKIPASEGGVESLNVGVAAGICLYALQSGE